MKSREGAESLVRINVVRTEAAQRKARPGTEEARGPKTREGHVSIRYLLTTVIHTQKINIFPPGVMVANILSKFRNNLFESNVQDRQVKAIQMVTEKF